MTEMNNFIFFHYTNKQKYLFSHSTIIYNQISMKECISMPCVREIMDIVSVALSSCKNTYED